MVCAIRNYLRVRGEYSFTRFSKGVHYGTTSACAENTEPQASS